jgi:ABC-type multidrug transport system fused ATPase/permease subunit
MDIVDSTLSFSLRLFVSCVVQVVATLVVICISTPIFIVVIPPLAFVYVTAMVSCRHSSIIRYGMCVCLQRYYIATARQLQRLQSISRSPIYSHFAETVQGAASIRAFRLTEHFARITEQKASPTKPNRDLS